MYRLFHFIKKESQWGYPAPHLLAMHFYPGGSTGGAAQDQIELHFSVEGVRIVGDSLLELWQRLVAGGGGTDPKEPIFVITGKEGVEKITVVDYNNNPATSGEEDES